MSSYAPPKLSGSVYPATKDFRRVSLNAANWRKLFYKGDTDISERLAISYEQMANQAQSVAGYDAC